MRLDKFNNPIFNEVDVFNFLYQGHTSKLTDLMVERSPDITQFETITNTNFLSPILEDLSIAEMDTINQNKWFMPSKYYEFDIQAYCISKCSTVEEQARVFEELEEFSTRNMTGLLQWLKYFVDTCMENNIVWGVGRGSSVASFVLYLIGVHKIHSIKYKLEWQEFLR